MHHDAPPLIIDAEDGISPDSWIGSREGNWMTAAFEKFTKELQVGPDVEDCDHAISTVGSEEREELEMVPGAGDTDDLLVEEVRIDDVSIDGMCGVY